MKAIALTIAAAGMMLAAFPVHAQGNGITHQHVPGEKRASRKGGPGETGSAYVTKLTEANVKGFIGDVQRIVMTGSQSMTAQDVADWFNNHIADKATFESTMKYEMPGYPAQESAMQLGKTEYINGVLSRGAMSDYKQTIDIVEIKIGSGGRVAHVKTKITETGMMPWPKDEPSPDGVIGETEPMPVTGTANCEQTIGISLNNFIQMQKAECYTVMSFDPFKKEELGADMFFGR